MAPSYSTKLVLTTYDIVGLAPLNLRSWTAASGMVILFWPIADDRLDYG